MSRPPVALVYHVVAVPPKDADAEERSLFVDPIAFSRQMERLARSGYRTLRLEEYTAALDGRLSTQKRVLITFDDGYVHVDETVSPILQRHGFTAVMFVPSAHLGERTRWGAKHDHLSRLQIMTAEQVRGLASGPWELACHGHNHVDLRLLGREQRRRELVEAREHLSELLGDQIRSLAYPFGYHNGAVREDARWAGFLMAFTTTGIGCGDRFQLPRRAIRGYDTALLFRLKCAPFADWLYRARRLVRARRRRHVGRMAT